MSGYGDIGASALGPNMWLVDEMYRRFQEDPDSVDERWREFFEGFRPRIGEAMPAGALAEAVAEQGEAARENTDGASPAPTRPRDAAPGAKSPETPAKEIPE